MAELVGYRNKGGSGDWGRIDFGNGESCLITHQKKVVSVIKSTQDSSLTTLYKKSLDKAYNRSGTFDNLYQDDLTPVDMTPSILKSFVNAVLHCKDFAEVKHILNQNNSNQSIPRSSSLNEENNMLTQPISIIIAGSLIALSILGEGYLDRKNTKGKVDRCYSFYEKQQLSGDKLEYLLTECEEKFH